MVRALFFLLHLPRVSYWHVSLWLITNCCFKSGMYGSRRLCIITGMPGAYHEPIPLLILACLPGVAKHIVHR